MNINIALGNCIITRSGKCINTRQFSDFLEVIDNDSSVDYNDSLSMIFEEFGDTYENLVKVKDNVIFPIVDIDILKRYFRYGLSKELVSMFDEAGLNIQDTEGDREEFQRAYLAYLEEFKKHEQEKVKITNSLEKVEKSNENVKQNVKTK